MAIEPFGNSLVESHFLFFETNKYFPSESVVALYAVMVLLSKPFVIIVYNP